MDIPISMAAYDASCRDLSTLTATTAFSDIVASPYTGWTTQGGYYVFHFTNDLTATEQAAFYQRVFNSPVMEDLITKAKTALTNNVNFLAIVSPTNAQAVAQVQALTRQVDALIRLAVGQLSSSGGT